MIDIKLIRQNPEIAKNSQISRGKDPQIVDKLLDIDALYRNAITNSENLKAKQNELGKLIPKANKQEKSKLLAKLKVLSKEAESSKTQTNKLEQKYLKLAKSLDNLIAEAPPGGEKDYIVLEEIGSPRNFINEGIKIKDHLDIGQNLNILDTIRGAKVSGARFYFLKGLGAQLELAIQRLALDIATSENITPIITPTLVLPEIMDGTGFLGEHSAEIYKLAEPDNVYLVGTSEVAIAGFHQNEILNLKNSDISYAGISTCYRREAGSYGKDTRGIIRVHQFNKVEMFVFCKPENAEKQHQRILNIEKKILNAMEIPYRIIDVAAGDLGSSAARKFDCEAYLPSQNRYLELTSTSNCTTYQARRLNIRYIGNDGKKHMAATLNGTLTTTRWLVALLENHQQADGSVKIPKALTKYMNGLEYIKIE
ncbi:MAG: serine--tRNA ligase [Bifidobacteriaceae bacterium]|jgi:seryl-tRNA synthetase|nr:serine--tRNA ligase [Bifidobacteriaceae bacterium]